MFPGELQERCTSGFGCKPESAFNLLPPFKLFSNIARQFGRVAQLVRVPVLHTGCPGFESQFAQKYPYSLEFSFSAFTSGNWDSNRRLRRAIARKSGQEVHVSSRRRLAGDRQEVGLRRGVPVRPKIPEHSGVIWHISPTPDVILPDPDGVVIGVGLYNPTEAVERHF